MSSAAVKNLSSYVKRLVETELDAGKRVLPCVLAFYSQNLEGAIDLNLESENCDIDDSFVRKLEELIKRSFKPVRGYSKGGCTKLATKREQFVTAFNKLKNLRGVYLALLTEVHGVLAEIEASKNRLAVYLKHRAEHEVINVKVQETQLECIRVHLLRKLYEQTSETPQAHVILSKILINRNLETALKLKKLRDDEDKYEELKGDLDYVKLLDVYVKLLKQKKKLDYYLMN